MLNLARKVKSREVTRDEIDKMVSFAKETGVLNMQNVVCGTFMLKLRPSLITM